MLGIDRVSLKAIMAAQCGAAALLSGGVVWAGLTLAGPQRRAVAGNGEIVRVSQAFAGALDRRLDAVAQDLRTAALALRQSGGGLTDADPQAILRAWGDLRPAYADLLLVGTNGRVRAAGQEEMIGRDVSGQPWWARTRNASSAVVTADATARDSTTFAVSLPVVGPGARVTGYLVARLGDAWLGEIRDGILSPRPAALPPLRLAVLAPDARLLTEAGSRFGDGANGRTGIEHATPSGGWGELGASGWLAVARGPDPTGGGLPIPDGRLVALWLGLALLAGGAAYGLTGRLTRRLARLTEAGGDEAVPSRIAEFREGAERLVARERSRGRALQESRTALARVRERLRTFEAMSGWTYWELDLGDGTVTWVDSGVTATADRVGALGDLTDGIDAQDRDLMRFTMQAALDGDGPHDVVLRRAGPEEAREPRRLLVRFIRAGSEAAPGASRLHALSREIPAGQSAAEAGGRGPAEQPAARARRPERRGEGILRQVIDGVVDDFNNLLTVIGGNLGTLKRRHSLGPEQSRLVDAALAGAQRGSSLTRRLVRFARRDETSLQETEIGAALHAFMPFLSANVLHQASIKIRVRPGLARALCSEATLEAVLLNLAFHMRDIGSEGFAIGADERVLSEEEDGIALRPGRYVRLVLASGTPARKKRGAEASGEERSTAAVASLLAGIGGGFRLLADGRGESAFLAEIWIPAGAPTSEVGEDEALAAQPRLRVLLVDSDTLVRESFAEALTDLGHHVTQAGSAEHALTLLDEADAFDVMIADQRMPVTSGLQLAATVVQSHPDLRIVLAGPQGHLPESARAFLKIDKPFRYGELATVMRRAADGPTAQAA